MSTSKSTQTYTEVAESVSYDTQVVQTYAEVAESIAYDAMATQTYLEVAESISYDAMAVQAYVEVAESTFFPPATDPDLPGDVFTLPLGDGDVWTILD